MNILVTSAKSLHISIFHMDVGKCCKDECLPEETNRRIVDIISDVNMAYSEHARRYHADTGLPKERTYVTGSPMAEVLHSNLDKIEASKRLIFMHVSVLKKANIFCFPHTGRRTSTPNRTSLRCSAQSIKWRENTICRFSIPVIRALKNV